MNLRQTVDNLPLPECKYDVIAILHDRRFHEKSIKRSVSSLASSGTVFLPIAFETAWGGEAEKSFPVGLATPAGYKRVIECELRKNVCVVQKTDWLECNSEEAKEKLIVSAELAFARQVLSAGFHSYKYVHKGDNDYPKEHAWMGDSLMIFRKTSC